jgi:hypothetical protein
MKSFVSKCLVLALLSGVTGCAHYYTGSAIPADLRTIAVPPFENASGHPRAEVLATQAVLAEFRRDGTLRITERENAALEMNGRITACKLEPMRFDHDHPYRSVQYRLTVTAEVKVYERATGKVVAKLGKVTGSDIFSTQSDLPSTERDAMPRAAAKLAQAIVRDTLLSW